MIDVEAKDMNWHELVEQRMSQIDEDRQWQSSMYESKLVSKLKELKEQSRTDDAISAEILYKLGLIYGYGSPNDIPVKSRLIQCAGLLNAALQFQTSNRDPDSSSLRSLVQHDLSAFCAHVLRLANPNYTGGDNLVEKAEQVKKSFEELRSSDKLHDKEVSTIIAEVAMKFTKIMADLFKFCEGVMGGAPCRYAVVGFGSLARKEATPYSKFKYGIILQDSDHKQTVVEFFRWLHVIFHLVILNLKETSIPDLHIPNLHDLATYPNTCWLDDPIAASSVSLDGSSGVSLDGLKPGGTLRPFGKEPVELIKPISDMVTALSVEEGLHEVYKLTNLVTETSFVHGDEQIYFEFEKIVSEKFPRSADLFLDAEVKETNPAKLQIKECFKYGDVFFKLKPTRTVPRVDISSLLTVFVAALGRFHACENTVKSSFDIVSDLAKREKISTLTKEKLLFAVRIAGKMRLRANVVKESPGFLKMEDLQELFSASDIINFFQVVFCLHCQVAKILEMTKPFILDEAKWVNTAICFTCGIDVKALRVTEDGLNFASFNFDDFVAKLESQTNERFLSFFAPSSKVEQLQEIAKNLYESQIYDEALSFYKHSHDILVNSNISTDREIALVLNEIGKCFSKLHRYADSRGNFLRSLERFENIREQSDVERPYAEVLNNLGACHLALNDYGKSLECLNKSLEIFKTISNKKEIDESIASIENDIGLCHCYLYAPEESISHFRRSLEIYRNITKQPVAINRNIDRRKEDANVAMALNNVGNCLRYIGESPESLAEALDCLQEALEIKRNLSPQKDSDVQIAIALSHLGVCLMENYEFVRAQEALNEALQIRMKKPQNERNTLAFAGAQFHLGVCMLYLAQYADSLQQLEIARSTFIEIAEANSLNIDGELSTIYNFLAFCLLNLHRSSEAHHYLKLSLELREKMKNDASLDYDDFNITRINNNLGLCLMTEHQYNDALIHIEETQTKNSEEFSTFEGLHSVSITDERILNNIGLCYMSLDRNKEAFDCLERSLVRKQKRSSDRDIIELAQSFNNVGTCLARTKEFKGEYLERSRDLYENSMRTVEEDVFVARVYNNMGTWPHPKRNSLKDLQFSLGIFEKISSDPTLDKNLAAVYNNLGLLSNNENEALEYLEMSFKIYQKLHEEDGREKLTEKLQHRINELKSTIGC